jgi:hypothetical protein
LCKEQVTVPAAVLVQAGMPAAWLTTDAVDIWQPVGCVHCYKGFSGRTGIFQVMPVSAEMQALCFLAGANSIFVGGKLLTTPNPEQDEDAALFALLDLKAMEPMAVGAAA